jgi:hypothetical protein
MKRTWMRRKSPRRIARQTPAETEHKLLIREMRMCAVAKYSGVGRCSGVLQAAHLGEARGTSLQHGTWQDATMLCVRHHDEIDFRRMPSVFSAMPAEELRALKDELIHLAREFVAGRQAVSA